MSSGTPPESLRSIELEPNERPLRRVLGFLPLCLLIVIALVLSIIGVFAKLEAREAAAHQQEVLLAGAPQREQLPSSCISQGFESLPANIWAGEQAASSDAIYAEHSDVSGMRVLGLNGFNFWGDQPSFNFSQALGRAPWLESQLAQWLWYFTELDRQLTEDGRQLLIVVAPAKWELYRDYLPEWTDELQGKTHLDEFLERSGDLPFVDVRSALEEAKVRAPVYSAVNSHWTPYGAFAAWSQIIRCGADIYPESIWSEILTPELQSIDLLEAPNEFAPYGDETSPSDWALPIYKELSVTSVSVTRDGEPEKHVRDVGDGSLGILELPAVTTADAGFGTALILRDSTGDALSPLWAGAFSKTCQIRHNLDYAAERPDVRAEAEACGADTVLYVFTERYFAQTPPAP